MPSDLEANAGRVRRLAGYQPMTAKDRSALHGLVEKGNSGILRELYRGIGADNDLARKVEAGH